jgi:prepilin-type N-terminal cleavage/methylation domain-containing protein/prepilin-type processing-associated H-X9-DG protein
MNTRSAFTLLEMLVALAIIVVLAALVGAGLSSAQERSAIAQSSQNLRQLGLLAQRYATDNNGFLPVRDFVPTQFNWAYALYPLAYDNKVFPDFVPLATGANLKNTIFYSPVLKPEENTPLRSYAMNNYLAKNHAIYNIADNRIKLVSVDRPSATVLFADGRNSSVLTPSSIQFRNNGRALICFVDGHVESRLPSEVPTNPQDVFWSRK